jgi:hypothetical protein
MWLFLLGRCAQSTVWLMTACGRHLAGPVSAGGTRGRGLGAGRVQDALGSPQSARFGRKTMQPCNSNVCIQ